MSERIAMCPRCGQVLVWTFAFSKKEFYCLDCGSTWAMFAPSAAEETPELIDRLEALKAEWLELSAGLIADGSRRADCRECMTNGIHRYHASAAEQEADLKARERLDDRRLAIWAVES